MNNEEAAAIRAMLDGLEKKFDALRTADQEAIKVARDDVKERMAGFPAEYAKKAELEQIRETATRLDKVAVSKENFEIAHGRLEEDIQELLSKDVFEATVREWTVWRRMVDDYLAQRSGSAANTSRIIVWIGLIATVVTVLVLLAVFLSNGTI